MSRPTREPASSTSLPGCGRGGLRAGPSSRPRRRRARRRGWPLRRRLRSARESSRARGGARVVVAALRATGVLVREAPYRHRYPTCWRCGQELIFRVVDEWFIRADELRPSRPRRQRRGRRGCPSTCVFAWTTGSRTWATGASRASGTGACPLPFYPCAACGRLTVVGLAWRSCARSPSTRGRRRAAGAPPAVDRRRRHPLSGLRRRAVRRVAEVGDCWLDARHRAVLHAPLPRGPRSTGRAGSRPTSSSRWRRRSAAGSTRCCSCPWPSRTARRTASVMAHDRVLGEDGREMHKSWGNAVWLDEARRPHGPGRRPLPVRRRSRWPTRSASATAPAARSTRRFLTLWNVYDAVRHVREPRPAVARGGCRRAG